MKKIFNKFLLILFIFSLFNVSAHIQDALSLDQKNFLWKVKSKTGTVYVLGSLHFLKKEVYPLSRKIEVSFKESNILVVEANINNIDATDLQKITATAFYPENGTLERHVSRETYELIKKELSGSGITPELINKLKPWFLSLTLSSLKLLQLGYGPHYGIDMHFLSKASGEKRIVELESLDYQIDLLSKLSDTDQELFLLYTLTDLTILDKEIDSLLLAWKSGDIKSMESILIKSAADDTRMDRIYEKLIYERNRNMVSRIEEFLKTEETYFVIVGAGHLVGKKGIIEILKGKGYQVEQL